MEILHLKKTRYLVAVLCILFFSTKGVSKSLKLNFTGLPVTTNSSIKFFAKEPIEEEVVQIPRAVLTKRLEKLAERTPFGIQYSAELEKLINNYLSTRKGYYAKILARGQYYFPLFHSIFDKYDIPHEFQYLAVLESGLYPRAKSPSGAGGLWQFMTGTATVFGLENSKYVEDRNDPIKSTEAVCKYLNKMYKMFNDWDLVVAAYNVGEGNVSQAVIRAGGLRSYAKIRRFLPKGGTNFVGIFHATMYMVEYAKDHGIEPAEPIVLYADTDTIAVKQQMSFKQISSLLNVSPLLVLYLNPRFKQDIIPFGPGQQYTVRLPKVFIKAFEENEDEIYALAKKDGTVSGVSSSEKTASIKYKVQKGDYLSALAEKFDTTVDDIKKWNKIKSNSLSIGQLLIIYPSGSAPKVPKPEENSDKVMHVVKKGETLWLIARQYPNVSVKLINEWNNFKLDKKLSVGEKIIIYKLRK